MIYYVMNDQVYISRLFPCYRCYIMVNTNEYS